METTINLNSISSPIGLNLVVGILFLFFYLINKETRTEFHKLFFGVLISIGLSYAMTKNAFLLQVLSISVFCQLILMIFYQEVDLLPDWKFPSIGVSIISFSSVFVFNLNIYIIIYGVLFALILSFGFWFRYNVLNKDNNKKEYANLTFFIIMISTGFFFGLNNLVFIMVIDIFIFMISFSIIYWFDMDNTRLRPTLFLTISILIWFVLVHVLPEWDVIRLFL